MKLNPLETPFSKHLTTLLAGADRCIAANGVRGHLRQLQGHHAAAEKHAGLRSINRLIPWLGWVDLGCLTTEPEDMGRER